MIKVWKYILLSLLLATTAYGQGRRTEQRYTKTPDLIVAERAWYDIRYYDVHVDSSASWNTSRFQTACDSAFNDGGGVVYIPPGTWTLGNDSIVVQSNVTIQGAGMGATIIDWYKTTLDSSAGIGVFRVDGDSNIVFTDFEIDGNSDTTITSGSLKVYGEFDHALSILNAQRVTIKNMYIHDTGGDGIYFSDVDYSKVHNNTITVLPKKASSPQVGRNCVAIVEGEQNTISDNILSGGVPAAIDLEPNASFTVSDIDVSDNNIYNAKVGINMQGNASGSTLIRVKMVGGSIDASTDVSVRIDSAWDWSVNGVEISNGASWGVYILDNTVDGSISNCKIHDNVGFGIINLEGCKNIKYLLNEIHTNSSHGIKVAGLSGTECVRIVSIGNIIWNNDSGDSDQFSGIYSEYSDSCVFVANTCFDDQDTETQQYGFDIRNSDNVLFHYTNSGYGNELGLLNSSSNTGFIRNNNMWDNAVLVGDYANFAAALSDATPIKPLVLVGEYDINDGTINIEKDSITVYMVGAYIRSTRSDTVDAFVVNLADNIKLIGECVIDGGINHNIEEGLRADSSNYLYAENFTFNKMTSYGAWLSYCDNFTLINMSSDSTDGCITLDANSDSGRVLFVNATEYSGSPVIDSGTDNTVMAVTGDDDPRIQSWKIKAGVDIGDGTNYTAFDADGDIAFNGTARIDWAKITADNITQGAGTHGASALSDLQTAHDGNIYHIDEVAADPGFELTIEFVSVTSFNWVQINASYDGGTTHSIQIGLYNFSTTTWDVFGAFATSQAEIATAGEYSLQNMSFFVPADANYIGTGGDDGDVRVRFRHTSNGNANHDLDIGVVALYK
jgi:hypothetical protein